MKKGVILSFILLVSCCAFVHAGEISLARDGFEQSWSGGSGSWMGGWFHQGDSNIVSTDSPFNGTFHLQLRRGNGYADRPVSLAGANNVSLRFAAKVLSFEANDFATLSVSANGSSWVILKRFTVNDSDSLYHVYDFPLSDSLLRNTSYISLDAQMNAVDDYLFVDDISFYSNNLSFGNVTNSTNQTGTNSTNTTSFGNSSLARWHIQFNPAPSTPAADVKYWDLDLYDTSSQTIARLHQNGTFVMCYFSAGSWENWRPDASKFPAYVLGNSNGWPGERWLDIRSDAVRKLMIDRMNLGYAKGCDGFDPDNMDAYSNPNTGFTLTEADAINYYLFLANYSHGKLHREIGLKNALTLIDDVLPVMDWAMNEQCFFYNECGYLQQVVAQRKPVFQLEYGNAQRAGVVCAQANALGFSTLVKNQGLDAFEIPCALWRSENTGNVSETLAFDGFEQGFTGGNGSWIGEWYSEGDASIITGASPFEGTHHLRLRTSSGYVDRQVGVTQSPHLLRLWAKVNSYEAQDQATVQLSLNGTSWYPLRIFNASDSDNQYHLYEFNLSTYPIQAPFWISIDSDASATNDNLYIDSVEIL